MPHRTPGRVLRSTFVARSGNVLFIAPKAWVAACPQPLTPRTPPSKEPLREALFGILEISGLSDARTNPPIHRECRRLLQDILDAIEQDVGKIIITNKGRGATAELKGASHG